MPQDDGKVEDDKKVEGKDELDTEAEAILKEGSAAVKKLLLSKRDANAEAKKRRLAEEDAERKKTESEKKTLEEQGKFKELAEKHKTELDKTNERFGRLTINMALKVAAMQAGITDPADAVALCDRAKLKVAEDGEAVEGAAEAVEALKKSKPYLFGKADDVGVPAPGDKKPTLRVTLDKNPVGTGKPVDRIIAGLEAAGKKK